MGCFLTSRVGGGRLGVSGTEVVVAEVNVGEVIPKTGFFPEYLRYARELTDAPDIYHVAAAIGVHPAVIAGVVEVYNPAKRKSVTEQDGVLAPRETTDDQLAAWAPTHVWPIIIGDSGDRKTTAMNKAKAVLDPFIASREGSVMASPSATLDFVTKQPNTVFWYGEGAQFFGQVASPQWKDGEGVFTQLYDGTMIRRSWASKKRTQDNPVGNLVEATIERPRVTIAIGIALGYLAEARSVDWTGGLIARMLIFHSRRTRSQDAELVNEAGKARLQARLRNTLAGLSKSVARDGVYRLRITDEAAAMRSDWTAKVDAAGRLMSDKIRPLYNRIPAHILRIAAHYAISLGQSAIGPDAMYAACCLGNVAIEATNEVARLMSDDRVARIAHQIREYVYTVTEGAPGRPVPILDVTRVLQLSAHTLEPAIKSLTSTGEIRCVVYQNVPGKFLVIPAPLKTGLKVVGSD